MRVPFLPTLRVKRTIKCDRCGLRYPADEQACIHCRDLDDTEVEVFKIRLKEEQKSNRNLGQLFLYLAFLILLGMLVFLH